MFKKINLKIKWSIILFLIIFITIETIASIVSISRIYYQNFSTFAQEDVELNIDNCDFLISLATYATDIVIKDQNLIEKVKQREYNLNSLKLSSLSIMGITLYDNNNNKYYSDGMSGVLSFNQLLENQEIASFINDETKNNYFSIRTSSINAIYSNNLIYDFNQGVISYINKLYDDDLNPIGYLFIDFNPRYIYNNFFTFTNEDMTNAISFITFDDNYLQTSKNEPYEKYLEESVLNQAVISKDYKFLIVTKQFNMFQASLVTLIPMTAYLNKVYIVLLPMIILSSIFIGLSIYTGKRTANKVVSSLTNLNNKMLQAENYIKKG